MLDGVFKTAMKFLGKRQIDIARECSTSQAYVSKMYNGDIKVQRLVRYLDYFGFDVRVTLIHRQSGETIEVSKIV